MNEPQCTHLYITRHKFPRYEKPDRTRQNTGDDRFSQKGDKRFGLNTKPIAPEGGVDQLNRVSEAAIDILGRDASRLFRIFHKEKHWNYYCECCTIRLSKNQGTHWYAQYD